MNVIFFPDFSQGNPYQKALANGLLTRGITVTFGRNLPLFSVILTVLGRWKPDIIHLHWCSSYILARWSVLTFIKGLVFVIELALVRLLRIRIVWTIHNIIDHESRHQALELFFNRVVSRLCQALIVHSQSARNKVIVAYKITDQRNIFVIPHGNYIGWYDNTITSGQARNKLGIDQDDVVLLCFGLLRPYKGIIEFIDAFKKAVLPGLKLIIAGKPINEKFANILNSQCQAENSISLVFGYMPSEDVQIYMNASDIVVLPYRHFLTSGTALLAMSFGKPIIAPETGSLKELIGSDGGKLYPPEPPDGILRTIQLILKDDLKAMGERNLRLAHKRNWNSIAEQTCSAYGINLIPVDTESH